MTPPRIDTPRGSVVIVKTASGSLEAKLTWNPGFGAQWTGQYQTAQEFLDSEILRDSEPFTPMRTGMLVKSSILGTKVGSGLITWIAPYSRRQYYSPRAPGSETGALRGPFWFERAKATHGRVWIEGARRIAGSGK